MAGYSGDLDAAPSGYCSGCEGKFGAQPSRECFFGCSQCGSDLWISNLTDAGSLGYLCLRCVIESESLRAVLMASPMALALSRMAAGEMSLRCANPNSLCSAGCGRRTSIQLAFPGGRSVTAWRAW